MSAQDNFIHSLDHNLGKTDIAIQSILLAIGFVAIGLRLWSRHLQRVPLQVNDWLTLGSTVQPLCVVGCYVVETIMILLCGLGSEARVGEHEVSVRFKELTYAGDLLRVTAVFLIQSSLLHYYLRMHPCQPLKWLIYGTLSLCIALWIASLLATAFFCTPPRRFWLDISGHCGDRKIFRTGCAASELILDMFILILAVPLGYTTRILQIHAKRFAWGIAFTLGLCIIALTALRIKFGLDIDSEYPSYNTLRLSLVSSMVPLLGLIVACLPFMSPVMENNFHTSTLSSTIHRSGSGYVTTGYWKAEELDVPLVGFVPPAVLKAGQIQITSDWEIHSTRDSARLDRGSLRQV
ncbi:hypothetical protein NUU61_010069 [Penicillium alfredii]|uniref:Rhodopsin domain-containing protein n=1 Tax=Penicillium alfredii TaxID=1506179 RepID=A0A9W9EHJ2_9EURO|nr:uncharacterized protein NUU61_010069 [Penicillium alfredii]KAJ5081805.1 hypothetical protein NUU61_010069 [Penicillium alfredii]